MSDPPLRPIEQIADGLQRLIAETAERAAERAVARLEHRFERQDATINEMRQHMDARLDRQDETLRLMWRQMKGNGTLPID